MHLHFGHLYPTTMSTYGDTGNIICLQKRAQWRGIDVTVHDLEIGQPIPDSIDFYFFGGGQDAAQASLAEDLVKEKGPRLIRDIESGVPLLAICGGYQLLGEAYLPFDQPPIPGVNLLPVTTMASHDRMIGDLVITLNPELGLGERSPYAVGFENHSGKTSIVDTSKAQALGKVEKGWGNNGKDYTEGCVYKHAIGCYLHGSLLPKNPHLADWLLEKACQQHDPNYQLATLDDQLEWQAHHYIVGRYV